MLNSNTATPSMWLVLEKDELDETNFIDMFRNLSVNPKYERKEYLITQPIPDEPVATDQRAQTCAYMKHKDDSVDARCLMPAITVPNLDKDLELVEVSKMIDHLMEMFQQQAEQERYETTKALFSCKMAKGASICPHVENERLNWSPWKA